MKQANPMTTENLAGMTAAILAGGLGTRLRPVVGDRPKPLALVGDRPYLTYLLDRLADSGIQKVVLLTGHGADEVRRVLGVHYCGMQLEHSREPVPLGTGGAIRWALARFATTDVLVMNGDSWCDVDLESFAEFHARNAADLSLVLTEVTDASRYGQVRLAQNGLVLEFGEKSRSEGSGLINAGIYLISRCLIEQIPAECPMSLERDLIPSWIRAGRRLYGFPGSSQFLDIGTPDSYATAESFFHPRR